MVRQLCNTGTILKGHFSGEQSSRFLFLASWRVGLSGIGTCSFKLVSRGIWTQERLARLRGENDGS